MGNWREKEKLVVNIKPKEGKLLENNLALIYNVRWSTKKNINFKNTIKYLL